MHPVARVAAAVLAGWVCAAWSAEGGSDRYAIRLADSVESADLTPLRDRVADRARMPARVLEIKDAAGKTTSWVLAAGEFPTREQALEARAKLAEQIGLPAASLQVIELPR